MNQKVIIDGVELPKYRFINDTLFEYDDNHQAYVHVMITTAKNLDQAVKEYMLWLELQDDCLE